MIRICSKAQKVAAGVAFSPFSRYNKHRNIKSSQATIDSPFRSILGYQHKRCQRIAMMM